jgi:hypothetical protein
VGDPLDRAAQTFLGTINRAATTVQASYRQGLEINSKLTAQLRLLLRKNKCRAGHQTKFKEQMKRILAELPS